MPDYKHSALGARRLVEIHEHERIDVLAKHTIVDKATGLGIGVGKVLGQQVLCFRQYITDATEKRRPNVPRSKPLQVMAVGIALTE